VPQSNVFLAADEPRHVDHVTQKHLGLASLTA
jgi:hypothetical protein